MGGWRKFLVLSRFSWTRAVVIAKQPKKLGSGGGIPTGLGSLRLVSKKRKRASKPRPPSTPRAKGQRKTALSPDAPFGAWVKALPFLLKDPQTQVQVARLSKGRNLTLTRVNPNYLRLLPSSRFNTPLTPLNNKTAPRQYVGSSAGKRNTPLPGLSSGRRIFQAIWEKALAAEYTQEVEAAGHNANSVVAAHAAKLTPPPPASSHHRRHESARPGGWLRTSRIPRFSRLFR